ncbi:tyrosyl-DNA phosphodiesterase 2-like [Stegodyphus dumicola]|uniref:tyrosyl-DNA phosphodiesterase 2-like n=1 Tax=Stegodyphus dumicola TaxID=202533 RepID=UPI0015AA1F73|nr:tyrosyl-DNA phosphodiesterase 2-like [Stegodyphus dumicola]
MDGKDLGKEGFEHLLLNHIMNFLDNVSGCHINRLVIRWQHVKGGMKLQSVNDFFEDMNNKGAVQVNDKKEAQVVVLDGSDRSLAAAATALITESALSDVSSAEPANQVSSNKLKFITWNIDGLNEKNLKLRTKAIYKNILNEQADIVFLQEVIPESAAYFLTHLTDYHCLFGNEVGYFVGILLKKSTVSYSKYGVIDFPNTRMMRNALRVKKE